MSPTILLIVILVIVVGTILYMRYRTGAEKRTHEKKRNQYNDRI
jgi:heme/copper-type cytochrome/quinol oxidase subunit 2